MTNNHNLINSKPQIIYQNQKSTDNRISNFLITYHKINGEFVGKAEPKASS